MTDEAARRADQLGRQLRELERLREVRAQAAANLANLCIDVDVKTQLGARIALPADRLKRSLRDGLLPLLDRLIAEQTEITSATLAALNGAIVAAITPQAPAEEAA